ncbi:MAG: 4Fe-4S binding protein, partial [Gammaproteobacteria bacterium]|nr:4Fe-4S binding protein [Gammaproteobacteria bacterium]
TRLAQFAFWGVWWPFVMVSMMLMGRVLCGVFCPDGSLTELISRRGLHYRIPRWVRWGGWPFVAFVMTTVFGQLLSVYEYPKATLLILGGSTLMALAVGYVYGRGARVWCRYLCPANGVFGLLARLAPVHFHVDRAAWKSKPAGTPAVACAPLINIPRMSGASACHACGRCSGHRDAVQLVTRSPSAEVLSLSPDTVSRWEVILLLFGVLGVALGAFQWSASPWLVALKQAIATWLVAHDSYALLADNAPWWLLTHYPEANDVFTWLDGLLVLFYIGAVALVTGGWLLMSLWAAEKFLGRTGERWRLAYALIPLAGTGAFLGLSMLTVTLLRAEGLVLAWVPTVRAALLVAAVSWSAWLAWRMLAKTGVPGPRRASSFAVMLAGMALPAGMWFVQFFIW